MSKPEVILNDLEEHYPILKTCRQSILDAYKILSSSFENGGKLLVAGNGGSAADSEHIVGELMKGFLRPRHISQEDEEKLIDIDPELGKVLGENLQQVLPALSVTGHVALSTAFLNDVNGILGFAQQVYGYGRMGDVFWGITTSGDSDNILYAAVTAKSKDMKVIALTGRDGGKIKAFSDTAIIVPVNETYRIQELHLPIYHALCIMLEEKFFG